MPAGVTLPPNTINALKTPSVGHFRSAFGENKETVSLRRRFAPTLSVRPPALLQPGQGRRMLTFMNHTTLMVFKSTAACRDRLLLTPPALSWAAPWNLWRWWVFFKGSPILHPSSHPLHESADAPEQLLQPQEGGSSQMQL